MDDAGGEMPPALFYVIQMLHRIMRVADFSPDEYVFGIAGASTVIKTT